MVTEQKRQLGQEAIVPAQVIAPLPEQLSYSALNYYREIKAGDYVVITTPSTAGRS